MNATLQCLLNSPGFADYFESEGSYISSGKYGLARSFAGLVKDARKSELKKLSPSDVKSAASLKSRIFGGYGQQDAHEFLVHFLEAVSIDVNRVKGKPKYVELDYHHNRSLQQNSDDWFDYYKSYESSVVTDYFCGQLMSDLRCNSCGHDSKSFNNFLDISLSFESYGYGAVDLTSMIKDFLKAEEIRDSFCAKEKRQRTSIKRLSLYKLPPLLIIHLKRFKFGGYGGGRKIDSSVNIKQSLDLSEFVQDSGKSPITQQDDRTVKNPVYELYGIVEHMGSLNGGHYTSLCKNPFNGRWYNFNDDSASESSVHFPLRSSEPYILFYTKKS